MREAIKVFCVVVLLFATPASVFGWADVCNGAICWVLRFGCPLASILALAIFLIVHFRPDVAPDYLYQLAGNYFNRGGFCFAIVPAEKDGVCYFEAYFQNQYDQPCLGRIALRPAAGFFRGPTRIEMITFEMRCEPGAFGVARIPVPVPRALQGQLQAFEVGASARYPNGKGRMLRFFDGMTIRTDSNFGNAFGTALTVVGALTGSLVLSFPAKVTVKLPVGVEESLPPNLHPEVHTIWKLGDPIRTA